MRLRQVATMIMLLTAVAAAGEDLAEVVNSSGVSGGLVVHVGCDDAKQTVDLHVSSSYVVQGLDTDAASIDAARDHIRSKGLAGEVTADTFDGEHLPYTDNLVNLLVVSDAHSVSRDEMLRALAPLGVACLRQGEKWQKIVKPWPKEIDEWTHYLHGPDNNAVAHDTVTGPPRHMQWQGEPRWSRNHHKLASISSVVTARGKLFFIVDEATAANMGVPGKWSLVARDAFSGVDLWKKPIPSWTIHRIRFRSGPPQVTRLLVVNDDRLYAPLGLGAPVSAIDATTGKTLQTFAETDRAEEIILADGTLLAVKGSPVVEHAVRHPEYRGKLKLPNSKSMVAVQAETGKKLWQWSSSDGSIMPETLASDGSRAFVQVGRSVVCLDLKSGKKLWQTGDPKQGGRGKRVTFGRYTLVVAKDVVLCKLGGELTALSVEDGEKLWKCKAGRGFHSPVDIFVTGDLVWQGSHVSDSVAPPPVNDFNCARDLHTGEIKSKNSVMVDLQTAGHHHRCYREKATDRYIITGKRGIEMMDLVGDNHSRNNWVRGTCQYGVLPANGLIYAPPHACGCYMESMLWGFWALSARRPVVVESQGRVPDAERLTKGPAYAKVNSDSSADDEAWPLYRHDALRSGVASTVVSPKLKRAWKASIGGELTQPVVAGGKVLLAQVEQGIVYALDDETGKVLWSHAAGGRVDSPPAIYKGMALFGSADGRVTCLRLSDGAVVWRFFAAPADLKTVALDQVESLWPVHGSVLLLDGVVYCSSGRSTWLDGGIDLYGLEPSTGGIVCKTRFKSRHPKLGEGKDQAKKKHKNRVSQNTTDYKTFLQPDGSDSFSMDGSISDVLVSNGADVFLHHARFNAKLQKQDKMMRHLFSTSSLLDDVENHRSHWVLGTGDFSLVPVAYSWVVNRPGRRNPDIAVPTGLMMVYTDAGVWGARRQGDANGRYHVFHKKNRPFDPDEESLPDFRRLPKEQRNKYAWKKPLPVRPRAMVMSGDNLFMGAMPVAVPRDNPHAAYEGRLGGMLWVVSTADGSKLTELKIDSPPVWDGIAAANSRLFVCTQNGDVQCWAGE